MKSLICETRGKLPFPIDRPLLHQSCADSAVAAGVAHGPHLVEQPLRRQLRKGLQPGVDHGLVRIQLVAPPLPRGRERRSCGEIAVQLPRRNPMVDRPATDPEAPRQLRFRHPLIQTVLQQHPRLPSMHRPTPRRCWPRQKGAGPHSSRQSKVCNSWLTKVGDLNLPVTPCATRQFPRPLRSRETSSPRTLSNAASTLFLAMVCGIVGVSPRSLGGHLAS